MGNNGKAIIMRRLVLLAMLFASGPADAGESADFVHQFADAWAHYRDALYQSAPDRDDRSATEEALRAFRSAWSGLIRRWAAQRPPQFGEDREFATQLRAVAEVAGEAEQQLGHGALGQAHLTLGQIRLLLAELRRRNGLHDYADELDAFDDKLAEAGDDQFDQAELRPDQFVLLVEQLAVLAYLAERLEQRAPPQLADDAGFYDMVETIARQVRGLKVAVFDGQRAPVVAALADLRRSFDRFYLLYG